MPLDGVSRVFLSGATLVLPDRVETGRTLVIEGDRIAEIVSGPRQVGMGERRLDFDGRIVVPGFIDVHVHGAAGVDVLDGDNAVARVAAALPRWGVTAFCPTTIASDPARLDRFLAEVGVARMLPAPANARVLLAHLESNFISPEFRGAQPLDALRPPPSPENRGGSQPFSARDILDVVLRHRADVGIVTIAPELPGGLDLVRTLTAAGIRASIGHCGANFEEAEAAIAAGATHATHLFNRMRGMSHRDPGTVGAVLASEDIAAEIIADGHHVHPAVIRIAIAAKSTARLMAITDGTAGSGLPPGARTRLGGRDITVGDVARLDDGTMAGSVATMAQVFATLVTRCGLDLVGAATMCSTTPARELGLVGFGLISAGSHADLTVLDAHFRVQETWIGGRPCQTPPVLPSYLPA
jgi:N-acetylglucosamine-6-phosphate deacetylase